MEILGSVQDKKNNRSAVGCVKTPVNFIYIYIIFKKNIMYIYNLIILL